MRIKICIDGSTSKGYTIMIEPKPETPKEEKDLSEIIESIKNRL